MANITELTFDIGYEGMITAHTDTPYCYIYRGDAASAYSVEALWSKRQKRKNSMWDLLEKRMGKGVKVLDLVFSDPASKEGGRFTPITE